jgi:prepilin peptidase CpaA
VIGWLFVALYALALVYAAVSDLRTYEIPNWVSLAAFVCFFPIAWAAGWDLASIAWSVGAGAAVLVVGFGLYLLRLAGAGDIKLMAAAGVVGGWAALMELLVLISVAGAVLALIVLAYRRVPLGPRLAGIGWLAMLHDKGRGIPYGVAIAAAALFLLPYLPLVGALRAR